MDIFLTFLSGLISAIIVLAADKFIFGIKFEKTIANTQFVYQQKHRVYAKLLKLIVKAHSVIDQNFYFGFNLNAKFLTKLDIEDRLKKMGFMQGTIDQVCQKYLSNDINGAIKIYEEHYAEVRDVYVHNLGQRAKNYLSLNSIYLSESLEKTLINFMNELGRLKILKTKMLFLKNISATELATMHDLSIKIELDLRNIIQTFRKEIRENE